MTVLRYLTILISISACHAAQWFASDVERTTFVTFIEKYASIGDTIYFPADTAVWIMNFNIAVVPRSKHRGFKLNSYGMLVFYSHYIPEKGMVNKDLIKELSSRLKIPQSYIIICKGHISRRKVVRLDLEISFEKLCHILIGKE